ncbi:hypothetical protein LTR84_003647 [Exophiala bonariae]|uniref:Short-chain dehydrogenase/reductase 3 n=1 Tax=Exophiala bonariae TaxID=1690606 RepID=A0AAV9N5U1_9EURO|nr:hypothetical protein LTR84_003647 [Exophiala bonariae]
MSGSISPLRSILILLQPLVSGALLAATHWYPEEVKTFLSSTIIKDTVGLSTIKAGLLPIVLFLVYHANKHLDRLALNNFTSDTTWDWKREVVLVTGGSSGIGAAIVRDFSRRGITVVNVDISPPPPSKGSTPLSKVHFYKLDVRSSAALSAVAEKIRGEVGAPTVVINNAGLGGGQLVLDESDETLERTVAVNLVAHFKIAKEFAPDMIAKNHGHVVTVASMASFVAVTSSASYAATKAGVLAFHEAFAGELRWRHRASRVRMTSVHPMYVRTALTEALVTSAQWKKTPQVLLEAEDVAAAVVAQVLKGESAQLILPPRMGFVTTLRGWPHWMQIYARGLSRDLIFNPK